MIKNISFKDVHKFIKSNHQELIENVDTLASLIILLSPFYMRTTYKALESGLGFLSDVLGVKAEASNVFQKVLGKIIDSKDNDPFAKLEKMEIAYCLVCYSAFFEALEKQFSELANKVQLLPSEKVAILSQSLLEKRHSQQPSDDRKYHTLEKCIKASSFEEIQLPHPVESFADQQRRLLPLYKNMAKYLRPFFEKWESSKAKEEEYVLVRHVIENLPEMALDYFRAQYYELAATYHEFFIWSNLHEQEAQQVSLKNLSSQVQHYIDLVTAKEINIGFEKFEDIVDSIKAIPAEIEEYQIEQIINTLSKKYNQDVEERIFNEMSRLDEHTHQLISPKKSEIFIPQNFKALIYDKHQHKDLEDIDLTWKYIPVNDNLGAFLFKYLSHPYSTYKPLIILGHPGAGKSLLTTMIARHSPVLGYTPFRVKLRGINADGTISDQIEEQLTEYVEETVEWGKVRRNLVNPPLVLLDGYDELLQASGKVFANYLNKVEEFQSNCHTHKQPTRVIVTSRITLIDKTTIPQGATVILLQEFNEEQRKRWIQQWNSINYQYFESTNIRPFSLPTNDKILDLAKQPLLLSMLALFDSKDNALHKNSNLGRSLLYEQLLRQFIERENLKEPNFRECSSDEQNKIIDEEMERFGIVALGMFNRQQLSINNDQLNQDLRFFNKTSNKRDEKGRILTDAEQIMGKFFFVYESKSKDDYEEKEKRTFEFLHRTFGEFLTAYFVVQKVSAFCLELHDMSQSSRLKGKIEEETKAFDKLNEWFSSLIYTPFHTESFILEMMREWLPSKLEKEKVSSKDFLKQLDLIVSSHIELMLMGRKIPHLMLIDNEKNAPPTYPLLGYLAIYTLNLIVLRTVFSADGFVFDERLIAFHKKDDEKNNLVWDKQDNLAWDRLVHLWYSWFSLEDLEGLTTILDVTTKQDGKVHLRARPMFITPSSKQKLDVIFNVSSSLGDSKLTALTGLFVHDSNNHSNKILKQVEEASTLSKLDLETEILTRQIQQNIYQFHSNDQIHSLFQKARKNLQNTYPSITKKQANLIDIREKLNLVLSGKKMSSWDISPRLMRQEMESKLSYLPNASVEELIQLLHYDKRNFLDVFDFIIKYYFQESPPQEWNLMLLLLILTRAKHLPKHFKNKDINLRVIHDLVPVKDIITYPPQLIVELIHLANEFLPSEKPEGKLKEYYDILILFTEKQYQEVDFQVLLLALRLNDSEFFTENNVWKIIKWANEEQIDGFDSISFSQETFSLLYRNLLRFRGKSKPNTFLDLPYKFLIKLLSLIREYADKGFLIGFYQNIIEYLQKSRRPLRRGHSFETYHNFLFEILLLGIEFGRGEISSYELHNKFGYSIFYASKKQIDSLYKLAEKVGHDDVWNKMYFLLRSGFSSIEKVNIKQLPQNLILPIVYIAKKEGDNGFTDVLWNHLKEDIVLSAVPAIYLPTIYSLAHEYNDADIVQRVKQIAENINFSLDSPPTNENKHIGNIKRKQSSLDIPAVNDEVSDFAKEFMQKLQSSHEEE